MIMHLKVRKTKNELGTPNKIYDNILKTARRNLISSRNMWNLYDIRVQNLNRNIKGNCEFVEYFVNA